MIVEAIVLAGGKGTRLQSVVKDLPKPMADIHGKPFLFYLLRYLQQQGITRAILSVGYKADMIQEYFQRNPILDFKIEYCIESEPLGTGGAIQQALSRAQSPEILVTNGDTMFAVDIPWFVAQHYQMQADVSIGLKKMINFDRYGVVSINGQQDIIGFEEKRPRTEGYINAGLYLFPKNLFQRFSMPNKFSLEQDFLPKFLGQYRLKACICDGYFIDIGIPEDYAKACRDAFFHSEKS